MISSSLLEQKQKFDEMQRLRFQWFVIITILIFTALLVGVWFKDSPPPQDGEMMPLYTEGGGKDNPLLVYLEELRMIPASGDDLLANQIKNMDQGNKGDVHEFLQQPYNVKRRIAWAQLMETDSSTWRWRLQDDLSNRFQTDLTQARSVVRLNLMQAKWLASEGKVEDAVEEIFKIHRMGLGVIQSEGNLYHFLSGVNFCRMALHHLKVILIESQADDELLKQAIKQLSIDEVIQTSFKHAMKIEYQLVKDGTNNTYFLHHHSDHMGHLTSWLFFRRHQSLNLLLLHRLPIVQACENFRENFPQLMRSMEDSINGWRDKGILSKNFHPNALGRKMIYEHLMFDRLQSEGVANFMLAYDFSKICFAIRRYELRHGSLPNHLNDLVPQFIDQIPVDPYDGKLLKWNASRKRVYSVYKNQIDDDGDFVKSLERNVSIDYGMEYLWGEPNKKGSTMD